MAATTAGALKALVESLGLRISAFRDEAPEGMNRPYATIVENIAKVPAPLEDSGPSTVTETAQLDVWQDWRDPTTQALLENNTLVDQIGKGLHGQSLTNIGASRAYVVLVRNVRRMPIEREENLVHHVLDLEVVRQY